MPAGQHNAAKTHCPKNHPYTEENTRFTKTGARVCITCQREKSLDWYHRNKPKKGPYKRWLRYGLTEEDVVRMGKAQRGLCKICKRKPSGKGHHGRLHVDHDKKSGKVRGLLCSPCNMAIGLLGHDKKRLLAAVNYLEQ